MQEVFRYHSSSGHFSYFCILSTELRINYSVIAESKLQYYLALCSQSCYPSSSGLMDNITAGTVHLYHSSGGVHCSLVRIFLAVAVLISVFRLWLLICFLLEKSAFPCQLFLLSYLRNSYIRHFGYWDKVLRVIVKVKYTGIEILLIWSKTHG